MATSRATENGASFRRDLIGDPTGKMRPAEGNIVSSQEPHLTSGDEQQRRATAAVASIHSAVLEGQRLAPADADDSASYVRGEITLGELAERTPQRHGVA